MFGLTKPVSHGDRIGVLRMSSRYAEGADETVATTLQKDLRRELRAVGFDAFDARASYDDLSRGSVSHADYYVEVVSSDADNRSVGGGGAAIGRVAVDIDVVVSRVAAEIRVYDGRTLELVDRFDLRNRRTAVVPTGIGVGHRFVWAFIALPLVQYGQYRSAAHEIARQAAERIARR